MKISLDDFVDDKPWVDDLPLHEDLAIEGSIEGLRLQRLLTRADARGDLTVLLSELKDMVTPPPHVYWVTAEPGSIRAWVYHKRQFDRLAYTNGDLRVVLAPRQSYPRSAEHRRRRCCQQGVATIPPFVIHGVQNRGKQAATFINMPTRAYDPAQPDKSRLPFDHPGIPYRFT